MSTTHHDQLITQQIFNTIKASCNVAMKKSKMLIFILFVFFNVVLYFFYTFSRLVLCFVFT